VAEDASAGPFNSGRSSRARAPRELGGDRQRRRDRAAVVARV
jgi:hypothetical protein